MSRQSVTRAVPGDMLCQDHEIRTVWSLLPTCIQAAVSWSVPHVSPTRRATTLDGCVHMYPAAAFSAPRRRRNPGCCLTSAMAVTRFCETSWCVSCRVFALGVLEPEAVAVPWYASGWDQNTTATATATKHELYDWPLPLLEVWQGFCLLQHKQSGAEAGIQQLPCCRKRNTFCPPEAALPPEDSSSLGAHPKKAHHDALLALAACCRLHCWFAAACPGLPCDHLEQGGVAVDAFKQPPPAREPETKRLVSVLGLRIGATVRSLSFCY